MPQLRSVGSTLIVVAFVVVDVFLVGIALRHSHKQPGSAGIGIGSTAIASTLATRASSSTSQSADAATAAQSSPVDLLSASGPATAWRAVPGCKSGSGDLSVTSNGGRTWTKLTAPDTHILRVSMTNAQSGWVVAADAGCKPAYYVTSDGGQTWTKAAQLGQIWLAQPTGVRIPSGTTAKPCGSASPEPVSLAPVTGKTALVVCAKGVFVTHNSGKSWQPTGPLPNGEPVSVAVAGNGHGVLLLADADNCSGLRVARTTSAGRSWTSGSCLGGALSPAAVSLDKAGDGLLVSAGRSYSSTDNGATWN